MQLNDRTTRLGAFLLALGLLALAAYVGGVILVINSAQYGAGSWMVDFTAFWGAARLAVEGRAIEAFDPAALAAAQDARRLEGTTGMPWLYPPGWHAVIAPLGLLPFSAAWLVFGAVSAGLFVAVTRPLARGLPGALVWLLAAPAVLLALAVGNNGLLSAACATAAVAALGAGRQVRAGLLIALLTLKPSLGILIPPVLLAGRQWRAFAAAAAGALAIAAAATALFGPDYWLLFFQRIAGTAQMLDAGRLPYPRMITWYGFLRTAGLGHQNALAGQLAASVIVIAAVGAVWTRASVRFDLKAAAFLLGLTLATPYAYFYEMILALTGILFLLRARPGWPAPVWLLFGLIWLSPALGLGLQGPLQVALIAAPLQSLALALALWQGFRPAAQPRRETP